MKAFFTNYIL